MYRQFIFFALKVIWCSSHALSAHRSRLMLNQTAAIHFYFLICFQRTIAPVCGAIGARNSGICADAAAASVPPPFGI